MPLDSDQFTTVMMELGPASPSIHQVVKDESGNWGVLLDDAIQVHLSLREAPARVELATLVGTLPENAAEVASMLLMFNLLSHETGGARMALNPDERDVFLLADLPEAAVDLPGLETALLSLAQLATTWRGFLSAAHAGELPAHLLQPF